MDDRPGQIKAHNAIARAAGRIGDDDAALDHLTRTLGLYEEGQQHAAAFTHLTFCEVLERQGRYADALDHVRLALDMFRAAGDARGQARSCNGIGW